MTLALALSLPTSLPYWWTIRLIAFDVVLFPQLMQAPMIAPIARQRSKTINN